MIPCSDKRYGLPRGFEVARFLDFALPSPSGLWEFKSGPATCFEGKTALMSPFQASNLIPGFLGIRLPAFAWFKTNSSLLDIFFIFFLSQMEGWIGSSAPYPENPRPNANRKDPTFRFPLPCHGQRRSPFICRSFGKWESRWDQNRLVVFHLGACSGSGLPMSPSSGGSQRIWSRAMMLPSWMVPARCACFFWWSNYLPSVIVLIGVTCQHEHISNHLIFAHEDDETGQHIFWLLSEQKEANKKSRDFQ